MVLRLRSHLCPKLGQTTWDTVMLWGGVRGSKHANLPFAVQGADWRDNGAQAEWDIYTNTVLFFIAVNFLAPVSQHQ